jgi:hypothetical protein
MTTKQEVSLRNVASIMGVPKYYRNASIEQLLNQYRLIIQSEGFMTEHLSPKMVKRFETAFDGIFHVERLQPGEIKYGKGKWLTRCCSNPCSVNWSDYTVKISHDLNCISAYEHPGSWDITHARERGLICRPAMPTTWYQLKITSQ